MTPSEFFSRLYVALTDLHPLHSMTVHFPIALAAVGLLFLILALWRRDEFMERTAFYCITLVALSTIVASLTGYRDVVVRFEGEAPYVNTKIFLGITLFILSTGLALARWRQSEILWKPSTMVLYVLGFSGSFLLTITLGFLGGSILYGF